MSKEQVRMMDAEDKLVGEADSPLTKLFRKVLIALHVETQPWNKRLTMFLKSGLSRVAKNAKDIGQERNNFNRAVAKRQVTFKTFQKAIQILGPEKYSMSITLVMRDGREITVDTGWLVNYFARLDSLSAAVTGNGMTPEEDIDDYDIDEDIFDELVDKAIDQIHTDDDVSLTNIVNKVMPRKY